MSEELKPCPFCGGEAKLVKAFDGVIESVRCKSCEASAPYYFNIEDKLLWNTRAASQNEKD